MESYRREERSSHLPHLRHRSPFQAEAASWAELLNPELGSFSLMEISACQVELQHIVDIKQPSADPATERERLLYREALVEWENQHKVLEGKVEKWDKRINQATNEIYQLVGLYSVFVGVVYTAVVQSNHLKCQHIWSPISLCGLAYVVISVVTYKRFGSISDDLVTRGEEDSSRKQAQTNLRKLKSEGPAKFNFVDTEKSTRRSSSEGHHKTRWTLVFGFLTVLTGVLMPQVETKVRNCTKKPLLLKEGNAGVYRTLITLKAGSEYPITCNTSATYREYWVGVLPDSTQGTDSKQASDIVTITSDDCVAYKRIHVTSSLTNPARLEVVYHKSRIPGATMLANHTNKPVTLTSDSKEDSKEEVLQPNRKVAIQVGTKHGLEHSVHAGGETLRIDNERAAKSQAVNIYPSQETASQLELEMVQKELLQTEVTNKTEATVTLRVSGQDHPLQPDEKYTIAHDPKSKDSAYLVVCPDGEKHISLDDISKYEYIDVENGASATQFVLKMQVQRSATNSNNFGWLSKVGSKVKGWFTAG